MLFKRSILYAIIDLKGMPMLSNFEIIDVMPTRIRIASVVRKAILSGELKEGQVLSLTDTATQLGVSRTPVREAFQILALEGLIDLRMNKSAIVKGINTAFIKDHYDMRRLLEGEAIARATINCMDVTELQKHHDQLLLVNDGTFSEEFQRYNRLFHTSIWTASQSPKLYDFLSSLWNGSSFGKTISESSHQSMSLIEHGRMLDAIRLKDANLARHEMEYHILRSMNNILDSYNYR